MYRAILRALMIVAIPVVVFAVSGYLMMHLTGRDQYPQTAEPASVPLNFRATGYDAAAVNAYWTWLSREGLPAEKRFLIADLVFPIVYGGAMLVSLLMAWGALRRPFRVIWLMAPVAITVLADWTENSVHLNQLARFISDQPLEPTLIGLASAATSVKLLFFSVSLLLTVVLCILLAVRGAHNAGSVAQQSVPGGAPASREHP